MLFRAALLALASLSFGCASEVEDVDSAERPLVLETRFDFTRARDRELFIPVDVEYTGAVGPYAAYRVIGPTPHLIGPRVRLNAGDGSTTAMLCSATGFFAGEAASSAARLVLQADGEPIVSATAAPMTFGGCAQPADAFSMRVHLPEKIRSSTFEAANLVFENAPVDSTMLVRMVDLRQGEGVHNGAHAINGVGCDDAACYLCQAPQ